ncbi:hypothetical protein GCM10028822_00260 [Hymenobacter terrigena]
MMHRYWFRFACACAAIFGFPLAVAANQVPDGIELQALRQFYTDTNGSGWLDNSNWLQGTTLADVATWTGVTVTNGDVTGLALSQNQLIGPVSTALGQLTALQSLDLSGNQLTGGVPVALGQLNQLQSLNLSDNQLSGGLPGAIGQITSLQFLVLSYNQFSRGLPTELGQLLALQTLDVKGNQFTGGLPTALGQLVNLQYLDVSDNRLTGTLPAVIGQWSGLTYLDCSSNQFGGTLPVELTQLVNLQLLRISYNHFNTSLPAQLGQLTNLYYLDAASNQLSGGLPTSMGQLTALRYVYLDNNQFNGDLPPGVSQWANVVELVLSNNQFTGVLPTTMGQWADLSYVQLNNNHFTGDVPAGLNQLANLQYLLLNTNEFSSIPDFSGNTALALEVANNQLEFGTLEPEFTGVDQYNFPDFQYSGQVLPIAEQAVAATVGQPFSLPSAIGGLQSHYQWQRKPGVGAWQNLPAATTATLQVSSATALDAGLYRCVVVNDWITGMTLYSQPQRVTVSKQLPPSDPSDDLNRNWTFSRTYDLAGTVTSESKQFSDAMGRPTQSQAKNLAEHHVFATQTINNTGGVAVLATLPAPTNNQEFKYKTDFVTATTRIFGIAVRRDYTAANFEKPTGNGNFPDPLDETSPGTLGYYYSSNNTWEPATAATHTPFSIAEPMPGPLGGMRRAAGPGDELRLGSGHELRSREFPLLNEMDHYSRLRARFVPGSATPSLRAQGIKSVSISTNGIESIAFTNREGQPLASCLSGDQYPASTLTGVLDFDPGNAAGNPLYQDIHLPASATSSAVTVTDNSNAGASQFVVIDLSQNPVVETAYTGTQQLNLMPGFYRLQVTQGLISFSYQVHYGNFSYVFYDDAGRAVSSIAPKGMAELLPAGLDTGVDAVPNFVTRNIFDTSGRVLSTTSPDDGTTQYVYTRDGRIRFSQSALQAQGSGGTTPRFSYSNYDRLGRMVESGEYTQAAGVGQGVVFENMLTGTPAANSTLEPALLEDRTPTGGLDLSRCAQRSQVWYDVAQPDAALGSRQQDFVLGAVAKTSNGTATTWYSYNDLGQLVWLVQQAPVVGVKTVDYAYDAAGNVTKVSYQQGQPDAFYHHYTYDANQRLETVSTSTDGATLLLQARYFYYLHGPLKRIETADNLQGTDYTYTVQGWLKSINGANRSLTGDSPGGNGFAKDLFGLTLDYFSGDYRSGQASVATPTIAAAPAPRYDGTVRSAAWFTAANPMTRQHVYVYDAKGQLKQAGFGQLLPGSTPTAPGTFVVPIPHANEEGNLDYDLNGNLNTLRRYDGAGATTDDFTYQYTAGTNKLAAVNNPAGAAVLDYDYDANGQMTRQRDEHGQRYLSYSVAGKVTGIYNDLAHQRPLALFTYDDRGLRASKASYDPATFLLKRTTYSVYDAAGHVLSTYVQEAAVAGGALQRSEVPLYGASRLGMLTRLDDGSLDYRYELNDQLGNARVIYHKPTTTTALATMEPGNANQEEQDFSNVATTRFTAPGHGSSASVARLGLTAGLSTGPSKTLTVERGDTVTFTAYAWLTAAVAARTAKPDNPVTRIIPLVGLTAPLNSFAFRMPSMSTESNQATGFSSLTRLSVGAGLIVGGGKMFRAPETQQRTTGGYGNAQLHYIVRDQNGTVMLEDYQSAAPGNAGTWQQLQVGLRLQQGGSVELRVETDGQVGPDVYFDDIQVDHTANTIVQEQHTYAYGAPMAGLNYVVGSKNYRHGYQGQFAEKDEETGWDDFELRMYDSRIGRWAAPDPEGQFDSPYVGMGNNPVSGLDPDGGWVPSLAGAVTGSIIGGLVGGTIAEGNKPGSFLKGAAIGAAIGLVAGGVLGGIGDDGTWHTATKWDNFRNSVFGEGTKFSSDAQGLFKRGTQSTFTGVLQKDFFQQFSSGGILNTGLQVAIPASKYMKEGSFSNTLGKINVSLDLYRGGTLIDHTSGISFLPKFFPSNGKGFNAFSPVNLNGTALQMNTSGNTNSAQNSANDNTAALGTARNIRVLIKVRKMPYGQINNSWKRL